MSLRGARKKKRLKKLFSSVENKTKVVRVSFLFFSAKEKRFSLTTTHTESVGKAKRIKRQTSRSATSFCRITPLHLKLVLLLVSIVVVLFLPQFQKITALLSNSFFLRSFCSNISPVVKRVTHEKNRFLIFVRMINKYLRFFFCTFRSCRSNSTNGSNP